MNVKNIRQGQKIIVNNKEYRVLAKVLYATVKNDYRYYKVFLSDGGLLVYNAENPDAAQAFGELVKPLDLDVRNPPHEITYGGRLYKIDGSVEYERVVSIEFGRLKDSEGECWWENYSAQDGSWISPGVISYDGKRADFFGEDMSKYDIKFAFDSSSAATA